MFSPFIDAIISWLRRNGVRVYPHSHDLPANGMYRSETKQIFLNVNQAREALLTLAHEAGHWLGYLIDEKAHSYQRERQAYVYGWHVLQWFHAPVMRKEWVRVCRDHAQYRKRTPPPPTQHLYRD